MNVAAHQEKMENDDAEKREAGKEKRQATDFKETECFPSAVVQRAARRKNDWMRRVLGVTGTLRKANNHFKPPQTGSGTATPR